MSATDATMRTAAQMRTSSGRLGRYILLVLIGLLLGINIYILNARTITGNQLPMPFGLGLASVQSGSMEPVLYKGDLLLVKERQDYAEGDIVVYQSEGLLVVHRIIDIDGRAVTTQGDANNIPDESFDIDCIKGEVVLRMPAAGYVIDFLKTPVGVIVLILLAALFLEISSMRDKKRRQQDAKAVRIRQLQEEIERLRAQQNMDEAKPPEQPLGCRNDNDDYKQ